MEIRNYIDIPVITLTQEGIDIGRNIGGGIIGVKKQKIFWLYWIRYAD